MANSDSGIGVAVDDELRIEDLVAAMLGVRLRKHHQFDVGRIASQLAKRPHQIVDLIARQRQPPFSVGARQRLAAVLAQYHWRRPRGGGRMKQARGSSESIQIDSVMRSCKGAASLWRSALLNDERLQ